MLVGVSRMWPGTMDVLGVARRPGEDRRHLLLLLLLILILLLLPLLLLLPPSTTPLPPSLVLLSTGQAAEYQGASLGIYDPVAYSLHDQAVYRQRGGSFWLYKAAYWYVAASLGDSSGTLRTRDLALTGRGWQYGVGGEDWRANDSTITLVPLDSPLARCLTCQQMSLSATGPAFLLLPTFLGVFNIMDGVFMDGKPVYRSEAGKFLHKEGLATFGVRANFSGDGASIQSASGPLCPFLGEAGRSERFGDGWKFWTGEDWQVSSSGTMIALYQVDPSITASCLEYGDLHQ